MGDRKVLSLDLETYSDIDLGKCGVYRYVEGDFHILLCAYAFDDEDAKIVDLACGEEIPAEVVDAIFDDSITKSAWNAQFERTCLSRFLGKQLSPDSWQCSMVWAAELSLPLALKNAALVLKTGEQKDRAGEDLIRYFSIPCKPTKSNGGRTRNLPEHEPEKWQQFKDYCMQDVRTERSIRKKLEYFPLQEHEWDYYHMDQRINDRGVLIDRELVIQAITCDLILSEEMTKKAYELTGLENPNSVSQLKVWLKERGFKVNSLGKKDVAGMITDLDKHSVDGEVLEMLKLRLQMAKSSVKKYQAAERCICEDGRARGLFQFSGAQRTQRWAGRLIQLQNLVRNEISTLDEARELVKMGCFDMVESIYGNTPDILSQLCRTMLIPKEGCRFIIADFSAIEARVLAWLAGEEWVLDAFRNGEDLYCSVASQMFGVPVKKHGVNGELRQKGKVASLACGYQGSVGAMISMGALDMGLKEDELQEIIDSWREANPNIVRFWWDLESAAVDTINDHKERTVNQIGVKFSDNKLWIVLPSGRQLAYINPKLQPNRFGHMSITYKGLNAANKWVRCETYGGRLVENCVAEGTLVLTQRGLVSIEDINYTDLVWDGEEWVQHDGLIYKGIQATVELITKRSVGIRLTPEHRIVTSKGWVECDQSEGLNWAEVRIPDCNSTISKRKMGRGTLGLSMRLRKSREQIYSRFNTKKTPFNLMRMPKKDTIDRPDGESIWILDGPGKGTKQQVREGAMEMSLLLRERDCGGSERVKEIEKGKNVVRMHEVDNPQGSPNDTWYEPSSCIWGLAQHEAALPRSGSPSLSQLRWSWNRCLRPLVGKFRKLLGRHGVDLEKGFGSGSSRQREGVQPGKLQMGRKKNQLQKQKVKQNHRYSARENDRFGIIRKDRYRCDDTSLPAGSWMADRITVHPTGCKERVYDIRNCGPRHRFAVWDPGAECLRIVSNCTQATARDLLAEAMWRMEKMGLNIVGHVHDEVILEVSDPSVTVDDVCNIMNQLPAWADGLVLNSAGYIGEHFYFKD